MKSFVLVTTLLFIVLAPPRSNPRADSDDRPAHQFELQPERVIIFKDGHGLIIKRGTAVTDADGMAYSDDVPDAAVLGSFWSSSDNATIQSMTAGWESIDQRSVREVRCASTIDIVAVNLQKTARFKLGEDEVVGTLLEVLGGGAESEIITPAANQFVVRTDAGDMLVSADSVSQLVIESMALTYQKQVRQTERRKRLRWQFDRPGIPVEISLMYFRPAVRWIPTYRIDLDPTGDPPSQQTGQDNRWAEIHLQAEILNEAEDLIDVPIDLVVGVPHFRFADTPSPMVLESQMRDALTAVAADLMNQNSIQLSNRLFRSRSMETRGGNEMGMAAGSPAATVDLPEELITTGANDLFVYHLPKQTLRRGERSTVPILSTRVPYHDVYTWDIELKHAESMQPAGGDISSPLTLSNNRVWRQVVLTNTTELPWTTGAAMFVDGQQPLAQELLTYTSPGARCRVPVTVAVDLRGEVTDVETGRKPSDIAWRGSRYTRVDGLINVRLSNRKSRAVPVEINLRFGGKADSATMDGQVRLLPFRTGDWDRYQGDPAVNQSSQVSWETIIGPGPDFHADVNYSYYLRR